MKSVDRIDINQKWPIPNWVPMMLLLTAIAGLLISRCSHQAQKDYIIFNEIELVAATHANIDIKFTAQNRTKIDYEDKGVLIRVIDHQGDEIASKITTINLPAGSQKRFLKTLTKFNTVIKSPDDIADITVEIYHPGLFN